MSNQQAGYIPGFEDMLNQAEERAKGQWEENFVAELRQRFEQYGDRTHLSEAQLDTLERIAGV